MTHPTLPLAPRRTDLRTARVSAIGDGLPTATFSVILDGCRVVILAPPKDCPRKGSVVTLRLTESGWVYAGPGGAE